MSFVCASRPIERGRVLERNLKGKPSEYCPERAGDDEYHETYALLTQPQTGEVAVLSLGDCEDGFNCRAGVIDTEETEPGANFLLVGEQPVSIVSTPGGAASFVASAAPGKEGLYGLPTSCIGSRPESSPYRDVRSWPACRLPSTPGTMVVLVDEGNESNCAGRKRLRQNDTECAADLGDELGSTGRVKLAVSLPSIGRIAIIDAQDVLDLAPGSFPDCPLERVSDLDDVGYPLDVRLEAFSQVQTLPEDWNAAACSDGGEGRPPGSGLVLPDSFRPNPSDLALSEEQLFVSDLAAPVIHVLDVSDPCSPVELTPLYPKSFMAPDALVTTRKVAVSPRTFSGERFAYAIDDTPGPSAGSIMVFDVTDAERPRTPLVRESSGSIDLEPPDRIQFDQEISDVTFARHDVPKVEPATGISINGVECDPDPRNSASISSNRFSLGALYRPSDDDVGPRPTRLRGVFAFATTHSGLVTTIDVEDLDAPCRRPETTNSSSIPDKYGCADDPEGLDNRSPLTSAAGDLLVSGELSCNIFVPHRPRVGRPYTYLGGAAPVLRAFPQLRARDGTSLAVDQSERGNKNPRLLGVNFTAGERVDSEGRSTGDAEVTLAGGLFENTPTASQRLELDPAHAQRNSVVLPYDEPRAYTGDGLFTATYEGAVRGIGNAHVSVERTADIPHSAGDEFILDDDEYGVLSGGVDAQFCDSGIHDELLTGERGLQDLAVAEENLDRFTRRYVDFAEITAPLLDEDDAYWAKEGRTCGEVFRSAGDGLDGRAVCDLFYGLPGDDNVNRELRIVRSYHERLVVEPRSDRQPRGVALDMLQCCFPEGIDFRVRAGRHWVVVGPRGVEHNVVPDIQAPFACNSQCGPLGDGKDSRVFELSCLDSEGSCLPAESDEVSVGAPIEDELPRGVPLTSCVLSQHPAGGIQPGDPGWACIHTARNARFAIYRGLEPSERGMQFSWRVLGGFYSQTVDLLDLDGTLRGATSAPRAIDYLPHLNRLVVADGGTQALAVIGLRTPYGQPGLYGSVAF